MHLKTIKLMFMNKDYLDKTRTRYFVYHRHLSDSHKTFDVYITGNAFDNKNVVGRIQWSWAYSNYMLETYDGSPMFNIKALEDIIKYIGKLSSDKNKSRYIGHDGLLTV